MILQKGPTPILMRLFTLIMMVVSDFSEVPPIFGKLILFISVLKPFFGKSLCSVLSCSAPFCPVRRRRGGGSPGTLVGPGVLAAAVCRAGGPGCLFLKSNDPNLSGGEQLCYVMLCYAMPCSVVRCSVMRCSGMFCHALSCHVVSCSVLACSVMP